MDWSKAKTILIIALLVTDLVLVGINLTGHRDRDGDTNEKLLMDMLASHGIALEAELPDEHGDMAALAVHLLEIGDTMTGSDGTLTEEGRALVQEIMASDNAVLAGTTEFADEPGRRQLTYVTEADGYPVMESWLLCETENGVPVSADMKWLSPESLSAGKMSTVPASVALLSFMREVTEDGADGAADASDGPAFTVTDIRMVYWLDEERYEPEQAVSDTAMPAWMITYNGGERYFFEAGDWK